MPKTSAMQTLLANQTFWPLASLGNFLLTKNALLRKSRSVFKYTKNLECSQNAALFQSKYRISQSGYGSISRDGNQEWLGVEL
jgi:hypothetical protein